ncbi:MAG: STAS domain-containing protein [Planctomycetota bacterium]
MPYASTKQTHGALTIVRPTSTLTAEITEEFAAEAMAEVSRTAGRLAIDLTASAFLDSRALEVLLDVAEASGNAGQPCRLVGVSDTVNEILQLTNLTDAFRIFEDAPAAARDLA